MVALFSPTLPTAHHCARLTVRSIRCMQPLMSLIGGPSAVRKSAGSGRVQVAVRAMVTDLSAMMEEKDTVVVYSKSYCPYCGEAKSLFSRLGVPVKVVELDELVDGAEVQEALQGVTGRRTVPQVFIGGTFVGGCDDTNAAYKSGKLAELLQGIGISMGQ